MLVYMALLSSGALLRTQGAPVVVPRLVMYRLYRWVLVVCTVGSALLHLWMVNQPLGHITQGSPWDPRSPMYLFMVALNLIFFLKTLLSWAANDYHPVFLETCIDARLALQRGVYTFSDQYLLLLRFHYIDFAMVLSKSVGYLIPACKSKALTVFQVLSVVLLVCGMLHFFEEKMGRELVTEGWRQPYTDYLWYTVTLGYYPPFMPASPGGCLTLVFARVLLVGWVLRKMGWGRRSRAGISRLPGDPGVVVEG